MAVEERNIKRHDEAGSVDIGGVARFREGERDFWKLREDGRAHGWVLAAVTLLQCQQIEPPIFQIVDAFLLARNVQMRWKSDAGPQAHFGFWRHAQYFFQAERLFAVLLREAERRSPRILARRFRR